MSPKTILVLAAVTVATVILAVAAVVGEPGPSRIEVAGEPAFPRLRTNPDAVATVLIRTGEGEITLARQDEGRWVVPTEHGYPAAAGRVRNLIVSLADMQLIEAKTANPKRFARLEVENVEAEESRSRLVRLADAEHETLVEVLIGKTRSRLTGTESAGTYLRRVGENRSWLASGRLDLPTAGAAWLDRRIVDLAAEEVVRVEVTPPDGAAYALVRDGDGWAMADADGARLAEDATPEDLAGALAGLDLEAVRPTGKIAWPDESWRFRFVTEAGLEVALRLAEVEGAGWAQLEATTRLDQPSEEAVERAAEISARTEGWGYRLPERSIERLRQPRAAWLEEDETS